MNLASLEKTCRAVRRDVINLTADAASGHPGGSLSAVEILTVLYCDQMNIDPKNPRKEDRDRFVLSKGHAAPALYGILAECGFFDKSEFKSFRRINGMLQGHPDCKRCPGVEASTGSLGQGVSIAVGMALGARLQGKGAKVYTLLGDGELQEGQVWEAAMFASHNNLDNLCLIVDFNGLQIDGPVSEVAGPEPIDKKFEAFGFDVQTIDGHDFDAIEAAFAHAKTVKGKPSVIIAKTVKGKGVSYMENQVGWHGTAPNKEQYETAMQELTAALHELEGC